jgi:hypothetical protein
LAVTGGINWAEIAGGFGFGAILAAVVTTYGGKRRERRRARSKALDRLMKIEVTRRTFPLAQGTYYDMATFARLASACMIAGVPRPVVILHDEICEVGRRFTVRGDADAWRKDVQAVGASIVLADDAAMLLRGALWRPVLTFPTRWWRTWRLRKRAIRLYGDFWPSTLPRTMYRDWLKEDKANRKAQRRGVGSGAAAGAVETGSAPGEVPGQ